MHSEVRATGDVNVMLPIGDETDKKQALLRALEKLDAVRLSAERGGGIAAGDPYPTVMFATRYGKLDILYRPDGSDRYSEVKRRSLSTTIGGQRVYVAARNDLVRMKLAAGRTDDLRDVANLHILRAGSSARGVRLHGAHP